MRHAVALVFRACRSRLPRFPAKPIRSWYSPRPPITGEERGRAPRVRLPLFCAKRRTALGTACRSSLPTAWCRFWEWSPVCMHTAGTSLTNRIPARLTVAGVAFLREWISKIIRMAAVSGIRSFDTSVSTCRSRGNFKRTENKRRTGQSQHTGSGRAVCYVNAARYLTPPPACRDQNLKLDYFSATRTIPTPNERYSHNSRRDLSNATAFGTPNVLLVFGAFDFKSRPRGVQ